MNFEFISLAIALSLFIPAPAAFAQRQPGPNDNARFGIPTATARPYQDYLYGVLKKLDKDSIVLEKTRFGVDQTIKLLPKTKFIRDGKESSLRELKVGDDVWVETKKEKKTGDMVAKKVLTGAQATP